MLCHQLRWSIKVGSSTCRLWKGASFPDTTGKMVALTGHVHLAYGLGGLVKAITHAMLGEKGKEYVVDNDSYTAIEGAFPGLFDAINKAKGDGAVEALMAYTDYEETTRDELVMVGGSSEGSSYGDGGSSMPDISVPSTSDKGGSDWKDIRYKFG